MTQTSVNECYKTGIMRVTVTAPRPGARPGGRATVVHVQEGSSRGGSNHSSTRSMTPLDLEDDDDMFQSDDDTVDHSGPANLLTKTIGITCRFISDRRTDRSACLPSPILARSWATAQEDIEDSAVPLPSLQKSRKELTDSEVSMYEFLVRYRIPTAVSNHLLNMLRDDRFDSMDLRFKSIESYHMLVFMEAKFGIRRVELTAPVDGNQEVIFWHRSLWDIVSSILSDPGMCQHVVYNFQPDTHCGDRIFSSFMGAKWMETASTLMREKYPECTVVSVILGSDGTRIKNRLGAHPIYITLGNLRLEFRQGASGWNLAGCVPDRVRSSAPKQSDLSYARRTRQI